MSKVPNVKNDKCQVTKVTNVKSDRMIKNYVTFLYKSVKKTALK